jgi:hypothetical protein
MKISAPEHQNDADPYADDPFFRYVPDPNWNACIGSQGDEENYIEGYIEAAIELVTVVVDKEMFGKRDTLVLPILYNARHALELVLKFITDRLLQAGLLSGVRRRHHNIRLYWNGLQDAHLGDEKINKVINELKPFIDSLARIDNDGQELRYHLNRSEDQSLANYSLANLVVIRHSLKKLAEIILVLRDRVVLFLAERETGTYTKRCSRRDLLAIAESLPRRDSWDSAIFDQQKAILRAKYDLSSNQFSAALNAIQSCRETRAILGMETDLVYLTDDEVVWFIERWRRIHPIAQRRSNDLGIFTLDESSLEAVMKHVNDSRDVLDEIENMISAEKVAELESLFYCGRDNIFCEYYEQRIESAKKRFRVQSNIKADTLHLINKTNFLTCVRIAAKKIGRISLAARLEQM